MCFTNFVFFSWTWLVSDSLVFYHIEKVVDDDVANGLDGDELLIEDSDSA